MHSPQPQWLDMGLIELVLENGILWIPNCSVHSRHELADDWPASSWLGEFCMHGPREDIDPRHTNVHIV